MVVTTQTIGSLLSVSVDGRAVGIPPGSSALDAINAAGAENAADGLQWLDVKLGVEQRHRQNGTRGTADQQRGQLAG